MTTISQTSTALLAQLVTAITGSMVVRARQVAQIVKHRRDAATLAGLDDRMLSDIGLTRGDLRDAYSEPVWSDPTAVLVNRAHERRVNRRRVSIGIAEKIFDSPSIIPTAHGQTLGTPVSARYY